MTLFHQGHYNKIGAALGRYLACELVSGTDDGFGTATDICVVFAIMFDEDSEDFDVEEFITTVGRHMQDTLLAIQKHQVSQN